MATVIRQLDDEVVERPFNKSQFLRLLKYMKPYKKQITHLQASGQILPL